MLEAHLICHTHWDREWYLTRMQFRTKLVRLIDGLLELAENSADYVSFMLDGQTIALEDYLEVKPYNRERLVSAIQREKIIIGPWYILPDELLISGESHIRNFLTGSAVAKGFGRTMTVGYLPDSFGHPAQMPQILRGLGLDTTVFWRGASNEMNQTEFYWTAPDGESTVLCVNMPNGYGTAARLGDAGEDTVKRLARMMDTLGGGASTDLLLLMNGSDHLLGEKNVPEIINAFNSAVQDKRIIFSTMEAFVKDLRGRLPDDLKTFSGNLCYGDKTILLGGTLSTRVYLKQHNHTVQKKLERYLDPLISHEKLQTSGFDYSGYQLYLSKLLLENHPHDSICGCSVDELHDEMVTRFLCLEQLEDQLYDDTCDRLQQTDTRPDCDAQLLLFEPTQDSLPSYIEAEVQFDRLQKLVLDFSISTTRELPGELPPPPKNVRAEDENGNAIPCAVLSSEPCEYVLHYSDFDLPQVFHANKVKLGLWLPGSSYGAHTIRLFKDDSVSPAVPNTSDWIENEYYRLDFDNEQAAFTVTDKKTGKTHNHFHKFVDMGDAGDEYSYSWPDTDRICTLKAEDVSEVSCKSVSDLCRSMTVKGVLRLPARLAKNRKSRVEELVDCPFTTVVTLYKGIDRIDLDTAIENMAEDHRLQVEFPAGSLCGHSSGSAAFAVTEHPVEKPVPAVWEEYPLSTALTHGFVDAGDEAYGISLASHGMAEYEAVNRDGESYLRLTLLRCVGWLSRPDLNSRKINGGWEIETPGGQCKGMHQFSYAVSYRDGGWRQTGAFSRIDRSLHPVRIAQAYSSLKYSGNPLAFVSDLPSLIRLSTIRPSVSGDGIILRFYSLDKDERTVRLNLPEGVASARLATLAELPAGDLPFGPDRSIEFAVRPGKIVTLELLIK